MKNKDDQFDTLDSTEYDHETPTWPLSGKSITCPSCHTSLYRVHHCATGELVSPYHLYCDRCPIRVSLRFWMKVKNSKWSQIHEILKRDQIVDYESFMRAIETALKPCVCGGTYRHDAPRRCFTCHAPVIFEPDVDLYLDDSFLRWKMSEENKRWLAQFLREDFCNDLWKE